MFFEVSEGAPFTELESLLALEVLLVFLNKLLQGCGVVLLHVQVAVLRNQGNALPKLCLCILLQM
jgi:hypothetical protein